MWNYYRDEPCNSLSSDSESFKYKTCITGNIYDGDDDLDRVGKNETEIVVPLKAETLKKFLENCEYAID